MAETLLLAGAALQIGTSIWSSQLTADAMEEQARIAGVQAQIALEQSKFAAEMQRKAGAQEATSLRRDSRRAEGGAVARTASQGLEVSGSPLVVIGEHIRLDELNAAQVVTNAHARAFSELAAGRSAAASYQARAGSLNAQADITRTAGFLDAIGAGMRAAGRYYSMTNSNTGPAPMNPYEYSGRAGYAGDYSLYGY